MTTDTPAARLTVRGLRYRYEADGPVSSRVAIWNSASASPRLARAQSALSSSGRLAQAIGGSARVCSSAGAAKSKAAATAGKRRMHPSGIEPASR